MEMNVAVILSPFASLRVNCATDLQFPVLGEQMQILHFAQNDGLSGEFP
jgi:hypothetical protein